MVIVGVIFMVVALAGITAGLFITCAARIRPILRNLQIENDSGRWRWNIATIMANTLAVATLLHIPIAFWLTDLILYVVPSISVLLIFAVCFNFIVRISVDEVDRSRKLSHQKTESLNREYEKMRQFIPEKITDVFHTSALADLSVGTSAQVHANILYINFFDELALVYQNDEKRFYNVLGNFMLTAGTIVHDNGSYFSHCTAHGLLALFSAEDTAIVDAILDICQSIAQRSGAGVDTDKSRVPFHAALYTGSASIALLSDGKTFQPVITAKSVDTTISLQNTARTLGIPMLIAEEVIRSVKDSNKYNLRYTGLVHQRDSDMAFPAYDLIDAYPSPRAQKIMETRDLFEKARRLQESGNTQQAYSAYTDIVSRDPHDSVALRFQSVCRSLLHKKGQL